MVKLSVIFISLLSLISLFFQSPNAALAATSVNLFQITSDGSQQSQPLIYKDLVAYTNFGGNQGIDIWGYNLNDKVNFPIIERPGQQFLTGLYKNLVVYEDVNDATLTADVRLYNLKTGEDRLIAGGAGSQTSGVTNGKVVAYINGGACGSLFIYDLKDETTSKIFNLSCDPVKISGDILIFPAADPNGTNIKGYDLKKNELFDISTEPGFQESANIFGDKVVWLDYITGARGDYNAIKMKDLKTGEEKTVYESSINSLQWPAISNKYVVWSESSAQHVGGVKGYNLKTGEVFEVQAQGPHQNSHTRPSIWNDTAVWQAWRTGNGDIYGAEFNR